VQRKNDKHKKILAKLGMHISSERKKRGITLEKLAYENGISKGGLSEVEQGNKDPKFTTLKAIASGLEISISKLLEDF
jgi:transcriptional regulator with XRE-family HTH domain